jgi:hypothetical protein
MATPYDTPMLNLKAGSRKYLLVAAREALIIIKKQL